MQQALDNMVYYRGDIKLSVQIGTPVLFSYVPALHKYPHVPGTQDAKLNTTNLRSLFTSWEIQRFRANCWDSKIPFIILLNYLVSVPQASMQISWKPQWQSSNASIWREKFAPPAFDLIYILPKMLSLIWGSILIWILKRKGLWRGSWRDLVIGPLNSILLLFRRNSSSFLSDWLQWTCMADQFDVCQTHRRRARSNVRTIYQPNSSWVCRK